MPAKDTASYWKTKVAHRKIRGEMSANYYARFSHIGQQRWINLDSGNLNDAANTAAKKFKLLKSEGWESIISSKLSGDTITIGQYIEAVESLKITRASTLSGYTKKLRQIAAEIKGIGDAHKYSAKGGSADFIAKVDKLPLSTLSDARVSKWQKRKLDERMAKLSGMDDEEASARAHNTVNSILRNAKGLFSQKILDRLDIEFSTTPLSGVSIGAPVIKPFQPEVNLDELIEAASSKLNEDLHLIFLLAAGCGLRRSEIDRLRRQDINLEACTIKIVSTEDGKVKTNNSVRTLNISEGGLVYEALKAYRLGFHVVCPENKRPTRKAEKYRCDQQFRELSEWLRGKGITQAIQPIHYLRKAFGDRIASKHGIDIAAISLGDSIEIAHKVYNSHNKTQTL